MLDYYLNKISACSTMVAVCAGSPVTYTDCMNPVTTTGCNLAMLPVVSGCFTGPANDTSGRTLTVVARTAASIVYSGSALAVALVNVSSASVVYITTCTQQYLVSGGTVDIPQWTINLADPT
jgi:hypothetical protein